MRGLILVAGAALALSACNNNEAGNTAVEEANIMSADSAMMANDTTAIDAATNMDANMAADAEIPVGDTNAPDATNASNEASSNDAM